MDRSDSRPRSGRGSGGGECASREGPRVGQGDPSPGRDPERAAARLCGTFRFSGLGSAASFPSAPGGSGAARAAVASGAGARVPRGPCARGAGAPRGLDAPRGTGARLAWRLGPAPPRLRCSEVVLPAAGAPAASAAASPCPRGRDCEARSERAWRRTVLVRLCDVPLRPAFEEGQRQRSEPHVISRNSRGVSKRSAHSHCTQW